jgi:hypothetical protein
MFCNDSASKKINGRIFPFPKSHSNNVSLILPNSFSVQVDVEKDPSASLGVLCPNQDSTLRVQMNLHHGHQHISKSRTFHKNVSHLRWSSENDH